MNLELNIQFDLLVQLSSCIKSKAEKSVDERPGRRMGDIDNFYVYVGIRSKGLGKLISYIGISIKVWARVGKNIGNFVIYKFY